MRKAAPLVEVVVSDKAGFVIYMHQCIYARAKCHTQRDFDSGSNWNASLAQR